jgi:leucyl aminopeptidase
MVVDVLAIARCVCRDGGARGGPRVDIVAPVQVSATTEPAASTDADTIAVGVFAGGDGTAETPEGAPPELAELISSGEARSARGALAVAHAGATRWIAVGLGPREQFDDEHARVAAAAVAERARELSTAALCWSVQGDVGAHVGALVEGTVLRDYRYERDKSSAAADAPKALQRLIISGAQASDAAVSAAALGAAAVNAARDLQNRPANDLTPTVLGEYASALAAEIDGLAATVEGRAGIAQRGMGAFAAVAQGSEQEPALITLHYEGPDAGNTPVLGFVGKAVTFDSGGISLKPGAKMAEMKFDMSGGAAVLEAVAAIARLRLPVRLVAVVGASENLPSGHSVKPGDIVTAANGKTIEVNNTDAEGRLVLADCLCHARAEGAEMLVDLATLTGAVIVALGSTYAGLMSNDDELAARIIGAGERTGETVWRLPLHAEYDELIKGTYADLDNAPEQRKAGTIVGGAFLSNFVEDVPWAHLDIAGSAWDLGREYVGKGASGYGVRLLVELARSYSA